MDPPGAYDTDFTFKDFNPDQMSKCLQVFMKEHQEVIDRLEHFEAALIKFKEGGFELTKEIHQSYHDFFQFFDSHIF